MGIGMIGGYNVRNSTFMHSNNRINANNPAFPFEGLGNGIGDTASTRADRPESRSSLTQDEQSLFDKISEKFARLSVSVTLDTGNPLGNGHYVAMTGPTGRNSFSISHEHLRQMLECEEAFADGMKTINAGLDNAKRMSDRASENNLDVAKEMMIQKFKYRANEVIDEFLFGNSEGGAHAPKTNSSVYLTNKAIEHYESTILYA